MAGKIKSLLQAKPEQSLTVNIPRPEGNIKTCWFLRPSGFPWLTIGDNEWKSNFKYIGGHDKSCSFNIIRMTNDCFGKWNVFTEYNPYNQSEMILHRDSFDILNEFQQNNHEEGTIDKLGRVFASIQISYRAIATGAYELFNGK